MPPLNTKFALRNASILGVYGIITFVMTWPWILHFTTHTPDWGGEGSVGLWGIWQFRYGLLHGSPFETNLLLPPYKINLVFFHSFSRAILALPLQSVFDLVIANNLLTLFSFSLSGLGMWLLAYDLTGDERASFIAGLVYAFTPYRFAHLSGHYSLITIEWFPFAALYMLRYFRDGGRMELVLAALLALMTSLTDVYYSLYLFTWSGLLILFQLIVNTERSKTRVRAVSLIGSALLIHLPFVGLLFWGLSQGGLTNRPAGAEMLETYSADLAGFITPSIQHPLFGAWAERISRTWNTQFAEHTVYLGMLPILLMIIATFMLKRWPIETRWWILAFWIFFLLALGPTLHWRGHDIFPLPYQWFVEIPFFREARVPSRWIIMGIMSLAVIVGQVLSWAAQNWKKYSLFINAFAGLIILFEYLPIPLVLGDRSVPLVYQTIAQDSSDGSVLDMPFAINDSFRSLGAWNPRAMYYQTITARPLIGSHISPLPNYIFEAYVRLPIIRRLAQVEQGASYSAEDVTYDQQIRDDLVKSINLRFIVIPDWYAEESGTKYILKVFDGCLENLRGDEKATGYRILSPCPLTE